MSGLTQRFENMTTSVQNKENIRNSKVSQEKEKTVQNTVTKAEVCFDSFP